jgi:hypothetical protein
MNADIDGGNALGKESRVGKHDSNKSACQFPENDIYAIIPLTPKRISKSAFICVHLRFRKK